MLKITSLGHNIFTSSPLANVVDHVSALIHRNFLPRKRQSRFEPIDGRVSSSQDFLLQDGPH